MGIIDRWLGREQRAVSIESPTVPVSSERFLQFFGMGGGNLPAVSYDSAMQVPAFAAAVTFLSGSMANLPLHLFKQSGSKGSSRSNEPLQRILNEAPNDEWSSYAMRRYFWTQVFSLGRGLAYIERSGGAVTGIYPINAAAASVKFQNGRRIYVVGAQTYAASEIIDVPFLLKSDQLGALGPLTMGAKAIQLALALNEYASQFFANGAVPPLALEGPMPTGAEAMKRAQQDIQNQITKARESGSNVINIPPGYKLNPVAFEPNKGQMTDARLFQIQEIARIYNLPPVFLQDLSRGTFANVEQQDLHLVKHLISQWAKALEDELNLKLFGRAKTNRYVEHNLDALMRGDLVGRMSAMATAVQNGLLTPDEGRALDNRPPDPNGKGSQLYMQGAMAPLGTDTYSGSAASNDGGDDAAGE